MTVSNALFNEAQAIKDTNSALEDIQETLALSFALILKKWTIFIQSVK
ncbi:hypothetical protein [Leuconostoc mesenteroides]|nr:hypothetical protein [Leuconostoc mesenteroides]MCP9302396.1 hypothetical protein [Leuconostoc mesenteroides]MCP9326147.1 hypothetical protein [Leuconostoc mesenteroides]